MPLRLEIKKILSSRSDRVKCVDLHPSEPWVLSSLYSGSVFLWDYETSTMVKSWEVCELPVRTAKFILRKQWFICASDDMHLRVFNYNTMEKVKAFEAHADYIRFLEIHPSKPFIISTSDDMSMKLWCASRRAAPPPSSASRSLTLRHPPRVARSPPPTGTGRRDGSARPYTRATRTT